MLSSSMRLASRALLAARPPPPPRAAPALSRRMPAFARAAAAAAASQPPPTDDEEAPETAVAYEEMDDGGVDWGATALATARTVLATHPSVSPLRLALYSFRATPSPRRVAVRLDALDSPTGSPSLDDVAAFSSAYGAALVDALGEETAGGVEVEASSPGADRALRLPGDLARFADRPLAVVARPGTAAADALPGSVAVLRFDGLAGDGDDAVASFAVADTRATRGPAGRLTNKQKAARYEVRVGELERVSLYVDI